MSNIIESGIIAVVCAILPIVVNLILRKKDREREEKRKKDEEQHDQEEQRSKELSIHICDEIGLEENILYLKIINRSQIANASNITIDMRIENEYGIILCEMKTLDLGRRQLLSLKEPREAKEREVVIKYTSEHIVGYKQDIATIEQLLQQRNIVIKIMISAINMITGTRVFIPVKKVKSENIKKGTFIEGSTQIQHLNSPTYFDGAE